MISSVKIGICETCRHLIAEDQGFECSNTDVPAAVFYCMREYDEMQCHGWEIKQTEWCTNHQKWFWAKNQKCQLCHEEEADAG